MKAGGAENDIHIDKAGGAKASRPKLDLGVWGPLSRKVTLSGFAMTEQGGRACSTADNSRSHLPSRVPFTQCSSVATADKGLLPAVTRYRDFSRIWTPRA